MTLRDEEAASVFNGTSVDTTGFPAGFVEVQGCSRVLTFTRFLRSTDRLSPE